MGPDQSPRVNFGVTMSLIKLYEASTATTLYGSEGFYTLGGWYVKRHDCAIFNNQAGGSYYKIYRDGTAIRVRNGYGMLESFDADADSVYCINFFSSSVNYYSDPIHLGFNPSTPSKFTNKTHTMYSNNYLWHGIAYGVAGSLVTKYNMAGTSLGTFSVTGAQPFAMNTVAVTRDGILVVVDFDNGTYGVVRFYDLNTSTMLYEATFDRSKKVFVDTEHKHLWSINLTTNKMQVWSFLIAPQNFTSITMGSNRARYRQDDLSVTLRGSINEPVPNWPVAWSLSTGEGHLKEDVTMTNASGVATNLYCGPGADDYVGGSQTITVSTGY